MTRTPRFLLILALMLGLTTGAFAQQTTATAADSTATAPTEEGASAATTDTTGEAQTSAAETAASENPNSYEVRNQFSALLNRHPQELTQILKLDPSLLTNESFMSGYPAVSEFIEKHPEVRRNTRFYLAQFPYPGQDQSVLDDIVEMILVFSGFALAAFAFGWLIRMIIEQKRWNRLSRVQTDVHTKILDRFGTSQEVLDYIKTPAGTKFLESAPIPLHASKPAVNTPNSRILWSIQLGVVIAIAALGTMLVALSFSGETEQGLFAMGAIGFSVGIGFVASAVVSLMLSRRLGLWEGRGPEAPLDDADLVR